MSLSQWQKMKQRVVVRSEKIARGSFIATTQSVIFMSPADTGMFKNNWFTEVNDTSSEATTDTDKSGSKKIQAGIRISASLKIGDSISLVNNLPYAAPLEYGYSAQAPGGMIRVTAAQWPLIVAQVTRSIK